MPLQRTRDDDLVRIQLPEPGEWVDVKRVLGRDDERAITAAMLRGQQVSMTGQMPATFDAGALFEHAIFATFAVAIKRWSFAEPVTLENLKALDDASVEVIKEWMGANYKGARSEADAKNSSGAGSALSSTAAPTPQNSPGSP